MTTLFRTSSVLTLSQGINLLFSTAITLFLTTSLDISEFGIYTFYLMVVLIISMFIDFGLNETSAQDLAEVDHEEDLRQRIGNIYFLAIIICVLFSAFVWLLSGIVDHIFEVKAGDLLERTWWLLFFVPIYELTKSICRGSGLIWQWAVINLFPKLFFLVILILLQLNAQFNLQNVAFAFALSYGISVFPALFILRPKFLYKQEIVSRLIQKIRSFGFNVMIGTFVFNMTVFFDRIFISLILDAKTLALYQLAITIANPIGMFSRSIGISTFRKYVKQNTISRKINSLNFGILVLQGVIVIILAPYLLHLFSLDKYLAVVDILLLIIIAHIFLGLKQPYAFFLIAKKEGVILRKIALGTALISFLAYTLLVSVYQLDGAVAGLIITYMYLFSAHVYFVHYK